MGQLQRAHEWLESKRDTHATRSVTYTDGVNSVVVSATVGATSFDQLDEYRVVQKIQSHDFLILAADLILAYVVVLPNAGDQIRELRGGKTLVYEVMALSGTDRPWRYSDSHRRTLRVHTKHVDTE